MLLLNENFRPMTGQIPLQILLIPMSISTIPTTLSDQRWFMSLNKTSVTSMQPLLINLHTQMQMTYDVCSSCWSAMLDAANKKQATSGEEVKEETQKPTITEPQQRTRII